MFKKISKKVVSKAYYSFPPRYQFITPLSYTTLVDFGHINDILKSLETHTITRNIECCFI